MVLESQRGLVRARYVGGDIPDGGAALDFHVVLHEDAILEDGDARRLKQFARCVEVRSVEDDVVSLPLARRARCVHERRILAIDGGGLAISVSFVLVRIEDLNFVNSHQEHTAIASFLAFPFWRNWLIKLDVQLAIAEWLLCVDVAGFSHNFSVAVFYFPFSGAIILSEPLRKIFAVEQDDSVGWGFAGRIRSARCSGRDDRGHGAIDVMDCPCGASLRMSVASGNHQEQTACDGEEDSFHGVHSSTLVNSKKSRRPECGRLWEEMVVRFVCRYSAWAPLMRMP